MAQANAYLGLLLAGWTAIEAYWLLSMAQEKVMKHVARWFLLDAPLPFISHLDFPHHELPRCEFSFATFPSQRAAVSCAGQLPITQILLLLDLMLLIQAGTAPAANFPPHHHRHHRHFHQFKPELFIVK